VYEDGPVPESSAPDRREPSGDARPALAELPLHASADEIAFAAELAALDRSDDLADGSDDGAAAEAWAERLASTSDAELLEQLAGPAHESDLALLASIDLASLSDPFDRVQYVQALDRVAGLVAAMQSEAVVSLSGASSSAAYLTEVHLEHELAVARRTSRYSAGRTIETARTLATTYPSFRDSLRAGEISPAHCSVLVDRTRLVTDAETLARIERLALPKARRLAAGEFGREVAPLVARFDRDATARVRKAREERRVRTRQLDDGMGYLGLTHGWPTIQAIESAVRADGRALQLERGGAAAVAQGDDDATADSCRADALATRVLGEVGDHGSVTWDRSNVAVVVNVVIDLDTLRGEADDVALLDGQPVPAAIGRDAAAWATAWRRLVTDPVDGHLLDYGARVYLPDRLRTFTLARDGICRTPAARTGPPHACRWTTPSRGPTARAAKPTAVLCASSATSSRPRATPTSSTPRPTARAPGGPPGARPSMSRPDRSSRTAPTPTRRPRTRRHRHPSTRHRSDRSVSGCSAGRACPGWLRGCVPIRTAQYPALARMSEVAPEWNVAFGDQRRVLGVARRRRARRCPPGSAPGAGRDTRLVGAGPVRRIRWIQRSGPGGVRRHPPVGRSIGTMA
jgi:hypothetical protein